MTGVIFANGTYGKESFYREILETIEQKKLICADGGLNTCDAFGFRPDAIVGDMDSVHPKILKKYEEQDIKIRRYPAMKNETDTELAVRFCVEEGMHTVVFFGTTGSRYDHSYANLFLLNTLLNQGIHAEFIDPVNRLFLIDKKANLELPVGTTVSILAYTDVAEGVTLTGFQYPLDDETLAHYLAGYGVSNVTMSKTVTIDVRQGTLLIDIITEES